MGSETTPEMLAMARRIAADMPGRDALQKHAFLDGQWDDAPAVQAALAAIKETHERMESLLDAYEGHNQTDLIPTALRNGEHYHDR